MFNNLNRPFEEDSFFASSSDQFQVHQEGIRQMMRGFSDPFGQGFMPSITDGHRRGNHRANWGAGQPNTSVNLHSDREQDFFGDPFSMMGNMRNRMEAMQRDIENMASDPNNHSFSSSNVVTCLKMGNEPPKVFEASSQTHCVPGGLKETRKCLKDSESGLKKMAIGHHIQDRGHVIERKENRKSGEKEFHQDFQNMDEAEAQSFDDEWQRKMAKYQVFAPLSRLGAPRH